jgi:hypothetical protein
MTLQELQKQALQLPISDRWQLVQTLLRNHLRIAIDPPPAPLKKGGELNSSPFFRGIEGDLLGLVAIESNS